MQDEKPNSVRIVLSRESRKVLLGAMLMYDQGPFEKVERHRKSPQDRTALQRIEDVIYAAKEPNTGTPNTALSLDAVSGHREFTLSAFERELLIEVLEAVLKEEEDDEYELELLVGTSSAVRDCLQILNATS
ncbi:MAG: hypothetical protein CL946_03950 [Ectothiorhodospiraceae bacterium]|nr:hypothetical protein [Ectothiorhodospiraceae bacterium]